MRTMLRAPMFWILLAAAGMRIAGLFWGLPASDGWDDDGFVPRNFLTALALTWKPGSFFTYPPLHALLLAIPTLPVAGWALAHAPSLSQHDVIATITQAPTMTYFAVVGRLVNLVMSLGIIWCVGGMASLVAGRNAGLFAALAAGLNISLTYYGQTGNLDLPYLFWALLSLWTAMQAVAFQQPKRLWHVALLAAAAIATKDQAYALFALSLPLFIGAWFVADAWPRRNARQVIVTLLLASAVAIFALLLVDGAITNPSGFARRVAFLAGPASGDYAEYVRGPSGWMALLGDMTGYYAHGTGIVALWLALLGLVLVAWRARGSKRLVALLPFLAGASFTICFNFVALRSDDRFLLPQAVLACIYIGVGVALLLRARPVLRYGAMGVLAVSALLALHQVIAVNAAMLLDPRYDAQDWMAVHVAPGETIETYGQNCFLPRFPRSAHVSRVGQGDLKLRNPLPGMTELRQDFSANRSPHFIVLSGVWAQRYLTVEKPLPPGRIYSRLQRQDFRDADARIYFGALTAGKLSYRLAHVSRAAMGLWPAIHIHDSLNEPIAIYERVP